MRGAAAALIFLTGGCAADLTDGGRFMAGASPVGEYAVPVASVQDRRFEGIIRQKYDFSCGSAALASLLRYHYDFDVREEMAFRGMWSRGDRDAIRRVGFSLLDMKRWLASRGIAANGYKVPLDQIEKTGVPGIALIAVKNYRHFVVVKGVRGGEVLLGDPSSGLTIMPSDKFLAAWNGIYFVLSGDRARAETAFNRDGQWLAYARAPVGSPYSNPISQQALSLTAPFYGEF